MQDRKPQNTSLGRVAFGARRCCAPVVAGSAGGFTLIEMLVVLSIMAIIAGMLWPVAGAIQRATSTASSSHTVAVAVETARFIDQEDAVPDAGSATDSSGNSYTKRWAGTAALFTASGQIRFVECNQNATDASGANLQDFNLLGNHVYYGYSDVSGRDYVTLPSGRGIVGIIRTGGGTNGLHLITPPFAVRFDKAGQLVSGTTGSDLVFYDGDFNVNGYYDIATNRQNTYGGGKTYPTKSSLWVPANSGYRTAFNSIETVIGVVLFDPTGINLSDTDNNGYLSSTQQSAIMSKGKVLLFNRYTGASIRKLSHD